MTRSIVTATTILFAIAMLAPGAALGKKHCKKHKKQKLKHNWTAVCVPGWVEGNYFAVKLPKGFAKHLIKKGKAIETGEYYKDADGDGYGATDAKARLCPKNWRADNNDDCDDGSAAVNPGEAEVCGNDTDENCNGEAEEGCVTTTCPCYTADDIAAAYSAFTAVAWDDSVTSCEDYSASGEGFSYEWAKLTWSGTATSDGVTDGMDALFYGVDYVDGAAGTQCVTWVQSTSVDDATGDFLNYEEDYVEVPLTAEEHDQCMAIIFDFAAANTIECVVTP